MTFARPDGRALTALRPITINIGVDIGKFIAATATDFDNNTSQFSQCVPVTAPGGASGSGQRTLNRLSEEAAALDLIFSRHGNP